MIRFEDFSGRSRTARRDPGGKSIVFSRQVGRTLGCGTSASVHTALRCSSTPDSFKKVTRTFESAWHESTPATRKKAGTAFRTLHSPTSCYRPPNEQAFSGEPSERSERPERRRGRRVRCNAMLGLRPFLSDQLVMANISPDATDERKALRVE